MLHLTESMTSKGIKMFAFICENITDQEFVFLEFELIILPAFDINETVFVFDLEVNYLLRYVVHSGFAIAKNLDLLPV